MKVLISDKNIHPEAIDLLKNAGFAIAYAKSTDLLEDGNAEKLEEANTLVIRYSTKIDKGVLKRAKNLKSIITCSAGTDHIDINTCAKKGVKVYSSPGANANAVAEHTVALILSVLRKVHHADKHVRDGKWSRENFLSYELHGKTLGIIGFGTIGKMVAKKMYGFGMKMIAYDPLLTRKQIEHADGFEHMGIKKISRLDDLIKSADVITIHVPLNPSTRKMISKKQFEIMKPNAVLINTSRGAVVDEKALARSLKEGKIHGAGLDVFEKEPPENAELLNLPDTILTPHIATMTEQAVKNMSIQAVETFLRNINK